LSIDLNISLSIQNTSSTVGTWFNQTNIHTPIQNTTCTTSPKLDHSNSLKESEKNSHTSSYTHIQGTVPTADLKVDPSYSQKGNPTEVQRSIPTTTTELTKAGIYTYVESIGLAAGPRASQSSLPSNGQSGSQISNQPGSQTCRQISTQMCSWVCSEAFSQICSPTNTQSITPLFSSAANPSMSLIVSQGTNSITKIVSYAILIFMLPFMFSVILF
jgi:hypothetical protein